MSKDNVVPLKPAQPPTPDADIVRLCRHLLEQAEAGQVRAVAVAIERADGAIIPALRYVTGANAYGLQGGAMQLVRRISDAIEDGREDV